MLRMNIVLLLNNDIASNLVLNLLMPKFSTHRISVFLSSKVGGKKSRPKALQELADFEQHTIYQCLKKNNLGNENQLKNTETFKSYDEIAQYYGIDISFLNEINSPSGLAKLTELLPDLIVSVRYGVILKQPIIDIAQYGVLNLHSGLLPEFRGVMATFWAMLNGEKDLSTTLHFIDDSSIDTGRIVATSRTNVQANKSYLWHVLTLYFDGCSLIIQTVENIAANGSLKPIAQRGQGHYYSFPTEQELSFFQKNIASLYSESEIVELLEKVVNS